MPECVPSVIGVFSDGWFSIKSQIKVNTVTNGKAAIKPPSLSLRLATSEISTTRPAVMAYLKIIQGIIQLRCMISKYFTARTLHCTSLNLVIRLSFKGDSIAR